MNAVYGETLARTWDVYFISEGAAGLLHYHYRLVNETPGRRDPRPRFGPPSWLAGAIIQRLSSALQLRAVTSLRYTIKQLPGITTGAYRPSPAPARVSERQLLTACRMRIPPAGQTEICVYQCYDWPHRKVVLTLCRQLAWKIQDVVPISKLAFYPLSVRNPNAKRTEIDLLIY